MPIRFEDGFVVDGNVAIGSTSASYTLDVNGPVGISEYLYHRGDNNTYLRLSTDYAQLVAGGRNIIRLDEGIDPDIINLGDSTTYTTTLGRMGVGTTSPSTPLDVNGVITATGGNSTNWNTAYGWGNWSTGVNKVFIDALNIDADTLDGLDSSAFNQTIGIDGTKNLSGATVLNTLEYVNGVITGISTRTLTLANLGYTGATNADNYGRWNFEVNGTNTTPVTSNAILNFIAGSNINITKNSNDITINATDTNTTYSAGSGLDLSGTTFSVETDLRDGITHIGLDTTDYISFTNNSQMNFYVNNSNVGRFTSVGDLLVDGDVVASSTSLSDRRLKTNIKTIENATDKVSKLRGVSYEWKDGAKKGMSDIGVIAQEVEEVLPEIVHEKEMLDGTVMKTVDYEKIIAVLIESNKELTERVKRLEDGSTNK